MPAGARGYLRLTCDAKGTAPFEMNLELMLQNKGVPNLSQQDKSKLLIQLEAGVVMTGLVLDADGLPVPRAAVMLSSGGRRFDGPRLLTDTDGRYRLRSKPGDTKVWIDARPHDERDVPSMPQRATFVPEIVTIPKSVAEFRKDFRATKPGAAKPDEPANAAAPPQNSSD